MQLGTPWSVQFPRYSTWYSLDFLRYTLSLVLPGVYSSCDMHSALYSLDYTVPVTHSTWCSLEYTIPAICTKRGTPWCIQSLRITLHLVLPGVYNSYEIHSTWYSLECTIPTKYTQLGTPWSIQFLRYTLNLVLPEVYSSYEIHPTWYSLEYTVLRYLLNLVLPGAYSP